MRHLLIHCRSGLGNAGRVGRAMVAWRNILWLLTSLVFMGLLGGGIAWQSGWFQRGIENRLSAELRAADWQVERLHLQRLGAGGALFTEGRVRRVGLSLDWQMIEVDYTLRGLLAMEVDRLQIYRPVLRLERPVWDWSRREVVDEGMIADVATLPEADTEVQTEAPVDATETAPLLPAVVAGSAGIPEVRPTIQLPGLPKISNRIPPMPVREFAVMGGRLEMPILSRIDWDVDFNLRTRPTSLSSGNNFELGMAHDGFSVHLQMREDAALGEADVWLQGQLRESVFSGIVDVLADRGIVLPGSFYHWGTLDFSVLIEENAAGTTLSSEWTWEDLRWHLQDDDLQSAMEVKLGEALAVLRYQSGVWSVSAGAKLHEVATPWGILAPFSMIFGYQQEQDRLQWQTERLLWRADWGTIEAAIGLEMNDLLVGQRWPELVMRLPQLRLQRYGIMDLSGMRIHADIRATEYGEDALSTEVGAQWRDAAGTRLGDLALILRSNDKEVAEVLLTIVAPEGERLEATGHVAAGNLRDVSWEGMLPLPWIMALAGWWDADLGALQLSGAPVFCAAEFQLSGILPRGHVAWQIQDLDLNWGAMGFVKGVRTDGRLDLFGVPRTRVPQRITAVEAGNEDIRLYDLHIEWEMAHLQEVRIRRMDARLDPSIALTVEPFSFDPTQPDVRSRLHVSNVQGRDILQWIEEDRFDIIGQMAGFLDFVYADGLLTITGIELELDPEVRGLLTFLDSSFVVSQLEGLGNLPLDMKNRLQTALIQRGVDLQELSIRLESAPAAAHGQDLVNFRLELSGGTQSDDLELPIGGLILNNLVDQQHLAEVLGLEGLLRIAPARETRSAGGD